ncbi:hypothetical protein [Silvimonas soli]|uniref:hypothetical protein n=1 Tax=Silvimonas soli TaxID=2980100 RepID=UPI0024B3AD87|nr:hypothetical protein [Silvimonas soli]
MRETIDLFGVGFEMPKEWKPEVYQEYMVPILISRDEGPQVLHATYGTIPKKHFPPGAKFSTVNDLVGSIGEKHWFKIGLEALPTLFGADTAVLRSVQ